MKKSVKALSVFLAVLMAFSVMTVAVSAEDTVCETHEYPENWTVSKSATCTESGIKYKKCNNCDNVITEFISSYGGHEFEETGTVTPPTCTEEGYTTYKCIRSSIGCKEVKVDNKVPALGHSFKVDENGNEWIVIKEPTCTESGLKYRVCAVETCAKQEEAEIPKLEHEWEVIEIKDADYVSGGYTKEKCKHCGEERTINITDPLPDKIAKVSFIDQNGNESDSPWYVVPYGETYQVEIVIRTESGKIATPDMIKSIRFESSDDKIAAIDDTGLITGAGTGTLNTDPNGRWSNITCIVTDTDGNEHVAKCSAQVDFGTGDWLQILLALIKILFVDIIGGIIKGFLPK